MSWRIFSVNGNPPPHQSATRLRSLEEEFLSLCPESWPFPGLQISLPSLQNPATVPPQPRLTVPCSRPYVDFDNKKLILKKDCCRSCRVCIIESRKRVVWLFRPLLACPVWGVLSFTLLLCLRLPLPHYVDLLPRGSAASSGLASYELMLSFLGLSHSHQLLPLCLHNISWCLNDWICSKWLLRVTKSVICDRTGPVFPSNKSCAGSGILGAWLI